MIRLIQGIDRMNHAFEIDRMHTIRADVFHHKLRWDVTVNDGWEIDIFDEANPLYIISIDPDTEDVRGSLRLLPTTGPNMLRDVFSGLLPDDLEIADPLIWEASRFSMDPEYACGSKKCGQVSEITAELFLGAIEIGTLIGLRQLVTVYDARMARLFRRANFKIEVVGTPMRYGRVMTYAGVIGTNQTTIDELRAASGHTMSVLEKPAPTDPLAAFVA
ncbi:acyl-homoserine-lactone synthase [Stappia sp. ES.058]|uniref:acyl-homoserine-lactone synthase n=1 Tax=Stappia sp. ES.058 TaxID=1881061 RepID=UPI00087CC307|nr:acyl-homoserine-lactone synthase [Stappia sp. ES.058]SDT95241.1 acyl homoserine lactone synthase [Stappia sp. ES.058]